MCAQFDQVQIPKVRLTLFLTTQSRTMLTYAGSGFFVINITNIRHIFSQSSL